jgi:hypothetical protein
MDQDDLISVEEVMRNYQATDSIICDNASGISDDVCLTSLETKQVFYIQSGIHTRNNGHTLRGLDRLLTRVSWFMHGFAGSV